MKLTKKTLSNTVDTKVIQNSSIQAMNEIKVALVTQSQEVKVHLVTPENAQTNRKFLKSASHNQLVSLEPQIEEHKVPEELVRW